MTEIRKCFVDIPDGQVFYRAGGSGEPILFLHQSPMSSDEFLDILAILAKDYRVLAMDTMGYGNSDTPSHEYEIVDFARSVINFLNALGIQKASIVGHHTGASIAAEVAAAYPERVDKLMLSGLANWELER